MEPLMNAETRREKLDQTTEVIIGCAYSVQSKLGAGFLEKVYENALSHEIRKSGLHVIQQCKINVFYDDVVVGDYVSDMLVENQIIIELKAVRALDNVHRAQCLNYLKATGYTVCLLINFGNPKLEIRRIVLNY